MLVNSFQNEINSRIPSAMRTGLKDDLSFLHLI